MRSRRVGALLAAAAVGVAVALFFILRDDDEKLAPAPIPATTTEAEEGDVVEGETADRPKPEPKVATAVVSGGKTVGGPAEVSVSKGERVQLRVEADTTGYVHVHGYDSDEPLNANGVATLSFPATIEGVFEVELHSDDGSHVPVGEITVNP